MARARRPSLLEQEHLEQDLFETVSRFYKVPITHVRRVSFRFHTGEHLSIWYEWQVREGDEWHGRTEFPPADDSANMPGCEEDAGGAQTQ